MENKETLEQASKEFANSKKWMDKGAESWVEHTFIEGAKWEQERMYSEEDLHNAFYNGWLYRGEEKYKFQFPQAKKDWFEQLNK